MLTEIPNFLAITGIVAVPAIIAANLNPYWFVGVLAVFAVAWAVVTNNPPGQGLDGLGVIILMFIVAAGLAVGAGVHLMRSIFRRRGMSTLEITLAAAVGSVVAAGFLALLFSR